MITKRINYKEQKIELKKWIITNFNNIEKKYGIYWAPELKKLKNSALHYLNYDDFNKHYATCFYLIGVIKRELNYDFINFLLDPKELKLEEIKKLRIKMSDSINIKHFKKIIKYFNKIIEILDKKVKIEKRKRNKELKYELKIEKEKNKKLKYELKIERERNKKRKQHKK